MVLRHIYNIVLVRSRTARATGITTQSTVESYDNVNSTNVETYNLPDLTHSF